MRIIDIIIDAGHFLGLRDEIVTLNNITEDKFIIKKNYPDQFYSFLKQYIQHHESF